jgi:hypothetical protein
MIAAHVAGMPVEELIPAFAGPAAGLAVARVWLAVGLRLRKDRDR